MTLDEQIKLHTEHVEFIERQFKEYKNVPSLEDVVNGSRQYIEWLTELRDRRESDLRPSTRFLSNNPSQQFSHIESEVFEVECALYYDNRVEFINELVDVQMSCETMLAILGLDEQQRMEARRRVIAKNKARGYYQEESV